MWAQHADAVSILDILCLEDLELVAARLELLEAAEALSELLRLTLSDTESPDLSDSSRWNTGC